ncbi:ARF-GAP with RHO-GAP domain, ank repeat and ph domain-containing protein 1 [Plakobranchus ocellatus]|uniref:ARF-GAP with RHO-GAP domain, ank repeat and ph domain-containing protein 1 n=1 Tax=Plakobranchus ocellatus TaxID=259542 RepID=A0AAV3YG10_9GAST|nr:ARF-GAP with RHO-GAP domain, ank repeat and ph domain-containing protein 1 [Plakobranchus ocellatus]
MPIVNFSTLKRIILHLLQVSEHHAVNKMPIANLASCFAPSLMRTNKDTDHLTGDVYSKEIKVIIDLLQNKDFFFHADEEERIRAINIKMAQSRIREVEEELRHSVLPANLTAQSWLVPCQILDRDHSVNVKVTETSTAAETMGKLIRSLPQQETYALYEVLFKGSLVRPIFPNDYVAKTAKRWMEFDAFVDEEIGMSLSVRGMQLLEILDNYNLQSHSLQAELQYSDPKSKKFKSKTVRFKQCQLAVYNKAKDADAAACWNVEDLSFYVGAWPKRNSAPGFFLTFLENDKKYTKAFGHCLGFSSEEDLYKWASVLYAVQNPDGLLGWASVNFS